MALQAPKETHTKKIEAKWVALNRKFSPKKRGRSHYGEILIERVWRSQNQNDLGDGFVRAFLKIRHVDVPTAADCNDEPHKEEYQIAQI